MAIDADALNLSDFYLLSNEPQQTKAAAFSMIEAGSVWKDLPLVTENILTMNGYRFVGGLEGPTWSPLNTDPTNVKALPTPYSEQSYAFANKVDIPVLLLKSKNARTNLMDEQIDAFIKAMSYDMNDKFFNNHHGAGGNQHCFVGVKRRLAEPDKYGTNSECLFTAAGGSGVDLSGSITANIANNAIEAIQELLDRMGVPEGDNVVLFGNDKLMRKLETVIRTLGAGGGFAMDKDAFGRQFMAYRNAKIRRAGRNNATVAGAQAQILTETETISGSADTGSTYTSLIAVRYGLAHFHGFQFEALKPSDPFKTDDGVTVRSVLHNAYGINQPDTRAIGRVTGFKMS